MKHIYLDNAATTPIDPLVFAAMTPYLTEVHGNPSSTHLIGQRARQALEAARSTVATAIGADDSEIIFTSGGTEADFLALVGLMRASNRRHIVTTAIEHHAVLHTCEYMGELGYEVTYVPPQASGHVDPDDILRAIRPETGLVSVMWVNNETGAIQPVETLASELRARGIPLHCDAVQALGAIPIDVNATPVSSLSFSGHKLFGPKGVGVLYLRRETPYESVIRGGSQEKGRRAGTENLAAIVGLATAVRLQIADRGARELRVLQWRDRFLATVADGLSGIDNHSAVRCAPHILNLGFSGTMAETLLMSLDLQGVAASAGSACTAGSVEPSHVLSAMGLSMERIKSSVRFSFSPFHSEEEIDRAAAIVRNTVMRLRGIRSEESG